MSNSTSSLLAVLLLATALRADELDQYNVVWNSPSKDARGSMPLGNGDIGINAWVESSGDLVFYVSKTDAWDENGRLCKVGRVRVKFDPPLSATNSFRQELKLRDGAIQIKSGIGNQKSEILLRVDANQPVVRLESEFATPASCCAAVEMWRLRERPFGAQDDSHSGKGLAASALKPTVLPDDVVASEKPRVVWYHRNTRSVYGLGLQVQHLELLTERLPPGPKRRKPGWLSSTASKERRSCPARRTRRGGAISGIEAPCS